jgi:oligoribonuclease NrnB/cAMP/cGMP phosphodiesterase (DHH superfamily)
MDCLTPLQKSAIKRLSTILSSRLSEEITVVNKIQQDPETGSSLCELELLSKKAVVWVRLNGSVSAVNGTNILLKGGSISKRNPSLLCFLYDRAPFTNSSVRPTG